MLPIRYSLIVSATKNKILSDFIAGPLINEKSHVPRVLSQVWPAALLLDLAA